MPRYLLRELFKRDEMVLAPGAGSPLDALLIEQVGYDVVYISGYCVAANRYGVPDIGLIAFKEMRDTVEAVCDLVSVPVIVDCDTGYGGILNVRQTVRAFESAGVAAVQIEDQTWPKRCGHMKEKAVEPAEIAAQKIEAAVNARRSDELVVIARTDAREILGLEEAIRRCKLYKSAGADVVLMHGPESIAELAAFASEIPGPKFVSIGEGEFTDTHSLQEFHRLGYRVALLPSSLLRTSALAVKKMLTHVKDHKEVRSLAPGMLGLEELNQTVRIEQLREFESRIREKRLPA